MRPTQYSSRLRYVDAGKLSDEVRIDQVPVYGWEREKLGHLDGFILDTTTSIAQYAVVKSGGWFNAKEFLLAIGHIDHVDTEKQEMITDVSKDAIRLFPEFDKDKFLAMPDEDLREFERVMSAACCPDAVIVEEVPWVHDAGGHYRQPSWWKTEYGQEHTASARTARP